MEPKLNKTYSNKNLNVELLKKSARVLETIAYTAADEMDFLQIS